MKRRASAASILSLLLLSSAVAQDVPVTQRSSFWQGVRAPQTRRAPTLLKHARKRMRDAIRAPRRSKRRAAILNAALKRLAMAHEADPSSLPVLYEIAMVHQMFEGDGQEQAQHQKKIEETLNALRLRDPSYRSEDVAFGLAMVHTRRHDYAKGRVEYGNAIRSAMSEEETITMHGNLAEITMMDGDLAGALVEYERSVALCRRYQTRGVSLILGLWGWAVALDRAGERKNAILKAQEAWKLGGGSQVLHSDGVFFEPLQEIQYYEALAELAQATLSTKVADKKRHLRRASRRYARFADMQQLETDPLDWAELARLRQKQINAEIETTP